MSDGRDHVDQNFVENRSIESGLLQSLEEEEDEGQIVRQFQGCL
jgi:hypothetical protein